MKKILKKIKNILLGDHSIDIDLRYLPVLDLIKEEKFEEARILEVGSGDIGITAFLKKIIIGADISFGDKKNKFLKKVKIKDNCLPFADNAFDLVLSVDSLEHVEVKMRRHYLEEMIRVAKEGIILMVPVGKSAYLHDCELDGYFLKVHGCKDRFLSEHVLNGPFKDEELGKLLKDIAAQAGKRIKTITVKNNTNLFLRKMFMKCKISNNFILNFLYYLFLFLLPFRNFLNSGDCYRKLYYIKF